MDFPKFIISNHNEDSNSIERVITRGHYSKVELSRVFLELFVVSSKERQICPHNRPRDQTISNQIFLSMLLVSSTVVEVTSAQINIIYQGHSFLMDKWLLQINVWKTNYALQQGLHYLYFDSILEKYTIKSFKLIKQIPLILKPRFETCICSFLMILFLPKFMINMTILILKLSISLFRW